MNIVTALEDTRTISGIIVNDGNFYTVASGIGIYAYGENGMYCELLWFAIVEEGEVVARLNGTFVESVTYA
jgi:hypothetical protein